MRKKYAKYIFSKSNRAVSDLQKIKIFTNQRRSSLYNSHLCIETEADTAVPEPCAAQAHSQGGVPSRVLSTGKNQPGLESEVTHPASGNTGGTGALW